MGEMLSTSGRATTVALIGLLSAGAIAAEHSGYTIDEFPDSAARLAESVGYSRCPTMPGQAERATTVAAIDATLANPQPYTESTSLRQLKTVLGSAKTAQEAGDAMSDYTQAQFGFPTTLDIPRTQLDTKLNLTAYKDSLQTMATYADMLPRKLMQSVSINSFDITNIGELSQTPYGQFLGGYDYAQDRLVLDINGLRNPRNLTHEVLGHALHDAECHGITGPDPTFSKLNHKGFTYIPLSTNICIPPRTHPDEFASGYAQTGEREDVAETMAYFMSSPAEARNDIQQQSILGEKTLLAVQRASTVMPDAAAALTQSGLNIKAYVSAHEPPKAVAYRNSLIPPHDMYYGASCDA